MKEFIDITHLFFDVDGVLTDGSVIIMDQQGPIRRLSSRDGYAIQLANKKGYHLCVITGGNSEQVKSALQNLGVEHVYLKSSNKLEVFEDHCYAYDIDPKNCLYMGDDIPDFEVMQKVGLSTCPADACEEIRQISKYVADTKGGHGCAREVIELVLRARGDWFIPKPEHDNFNEYTW